MTQTEFNELVSLVLNSGARPPKSLFDGGMNDWRARARLGHFLCMSEYDRTPLGVELLSSVLDAEIDEENPEDVEEKVYALQKLSACLREDKQTVNNALEPINLAIELAESTDYLYKYILRGELWADRWITLHLQNQTNAALLEADEKIDAYESIPIRRNSYLYYAYRFKSQVAGKNAETIVAKDFMRQALSFMEIPDAYKEGLEAAFAAGHENISWILNEIDRNTPPAAKVPWDI